MNRIRIGLIITAILATIWSAAMLFSSLTQWAGGVTVACLALIALGLVDWVRDHCDDRQARIQAARDRHPAGGGR